MVGGLMGFRLDTRIGFERKDTTQRNAHNEIIGGWDLLGQVYASREDISDAEKVSAGQQMSATTARFVMRDTARARSVSAADRLILDGSWDDQGIRQSGEVWEIKAIKRARTRGRLEITAVRIDEAQI